MEVFLMAKKILVIQNPVSGTIQNKMNFDIMINKLKRKRKYDLTIKNTTSTEGADEIIKKSTEKYDFIFVCGGDGTLNQVITEVSTDSTKKRPIIYMPLGTTNDFARSLKTKKRKKRKKNLMELSREQCDTGKINDKYFFNYIAATRTFYKNIIQYKQNSKKDFWKTCLCNIWCQRIVSYKRT